MRHSILILTNRIPYPLHDGGALAMDTMIRGYAAAGWKVHLLAMHTARHRVAPEMLDALYKDVAGFHVVDVDNTVTKAGVLNNLLFSREPEHAVRFKSAAFAARLRELLTTVQPDVVQLESPFLASYIPIIRAAKKKALLVYRVHNIEGQIWSRLAAATPGIKGRYLANLAKRMTRYERQLWQDADLLLAITEADASVIRAAGTDTPVEVAPFGIHPPAADSMLPPGPFKAYHIGAMDWLPNREALRWFLKDIWPKVHSWSPELTFHFAGRAMSEDFRTDLPAGAICEGEVANAQAFIADKHILVVPLLAGGGIRIKILEAMAQGKLVISTTVGMQGIEAQDGLHYLGADDAQYFAHLIAWAGAHREKAAAIASGGQELARERYDADHIMQRVLGRLETLLSGGA